jgi:hypothetical protein
MPDDLQLLRTKNVATRTVHGDLHARLPDPHPQGMTPQSLGEKGLYPLRFAHHISTLLVLVNLYILHHEGIVGGIHGGYYRLYLLFAGGGMVEMDERFYGKNEV